MLRFFIDLEGTVIDSLKSRNILKFNCEQIRKYIAKRVDNEPIANEPYIVSIYTWGWKTRDEIDFSLLNTVYQAIGVDTSHAGSIYVKCDAIDWICDSLWGRMQTLNLVNEPRNVDDLKNWLLRPGAMGTFGYTKVDVANYFADSHNGKFKVVLIDDLVTESDELHVFNHLEVVNPNRLAVRIDNNIDPTVTLYTPDGQPVGEIKNTCALDNVRVQICKQHLTGFYFIYNGQKIHIDGNGNVEDWPKGCFSYILEAAGELLENAWGLEKQINEYKKKKGIE